MASTSEDQPSGARRRPFREVAIASGLVTAADLDAAEAVARNRAAPPPATERTDDATGDAATATVLVDQGKLTPFQAREILAGRRRFRLGQYTVIDEIGRGGMGQVFKAEHALMGRHVAVKVLPRAKATPESEAAFQREMRILGRLDHENLVRAFDAGYDAMVYYLVTELVPGIDLRRQVKRFGPLGELAAASVFSQVARGLSFAHSQRLVHRDVKPGNIIVMDDGRAKVLDLGLAGSTLEAEAERLGRVVGTMDYIAPEQIRTPDDVGPPADIYALGCSMYFALAGEVPFPGGSRKDKMRRHLAEAPVPVQRLAPQVPRPLCHLVEAMMAKSVADRIGSADEVIDRLSRWTPDRPVPLPRRPQDAIAAAAATGEGAANSSGAAASAESVWPAVTDAPPASVSSRPDDTGAGAWDRIDDLLAALLSARTAAAAARVLVPAALTGVGCTILLSLLRGVDPSRYGVALGRIPPATFGWVAFLLTVAVRAATGAARQRR